MLECQNGPKAPKDPEKKREFFYIMRNLEITGSPLSDGRNVQFLYEDCGRLACSAKLTGNVTDEEMLKLLDTAEGFRRLVHSIGISIEAENPQEEILFILQMYGKTDPNKSGTVITKNVKANAMEHKILLEDIEWTGDDAVVGQIRFEFEKPNTFANASVCFYLNEPYIAPLQEEEEGVEFESPLYKAMIEKSLVDMGNIRRLKKVIEKAQNNEDVTLAYIGGSITQGAGAVPINTKCYAYQSYLAFCDVVSQKPGEHIHFCKAGVGGTSSEFGIVRYERDVLRNNTIRPDIVVVEFAVNDEGDETKGECYDSLVRKIYNSESKPAVILLFSVFEDDWNLEERLMPVGKAYKLPMVSIRQAVVEQFYKKSGQGRVISKRQFFYDSFHPTNEGHKVMADCLKNLLEKVATESVTPDEVTTENAAADETADNHSSQEELNIDLIKAPISAVFENVKSFSRDTYEGICEISCGGFDGIDEDLQMVERDLDLTLTKEFADNFSHRPNSSNEPFEMDIECSSLFLISKDSAETTVGTAQIFVDGKKVLTMDPHVVGWTHCSSTICFRQWELKKYHVEVRMKPGDENKEFTILGWGYVR